MEIAALPSSEGMEYDNARIADILARNATALCGEVLCDDLQIGTVGENVKAWDINGETVRLSVERM